MTTKRAKEIGLHKVIYNLIKCGFDVPEACRKMDIPEQLGRLLFNYEFEQQKLAFVPTIQSEEKHFTFIEMQMKGESYKKLYLPVLEENYTITKMSKV